MKDALYESRTRTFGGGTGRIAPAFSHQAISRPLKVSQRPQRARCSRAERPPPRSRARRRAQDQRLAVAAATTREAGNGRPSGVHDLEQLPLDDAITEAEALGDLRAAK